MKNIAFAALLPAAVLLTGCSVTRVEPAFKETSQRTTSCIHGGPDSVAQAFYDLRTANPTAGLPDAQQLQKYQPYFSTKLYNTLLQATHRAGKPASWTQGDLFSSLPSGPSAARVAEAFYMPNRDARNMPLRVSFSRNGIKPVAWQDEVLMVQEGNCWVVDDVRYVAPWRRLGGGTLTQLLEN